MIVDSHAHLRQDPGIMMYDSAPETCLAYMDRLGIDYIIQSFSVALGKRTMFEGYVDNCMALYNLSDGRMRSYFVYDPRKREICSEIIEKNYKNPAFVGIKIHPSVNEIPAEDASFRSAWELADAYGLPLMSHTWALTSNPRQKFALPYRFEKYIEEFKNVTFIFGHSGGRVEGIKEAVAIGKWNKNAYYDIAGDIYDRKLIEYIAGNVGANKLLLASDVGWFDISVQMGMILGSSLTLKEKELIMGDNAARIFGLAGRKGKRV